MKNFEIRNWMTENREVVIAKYDNLKNEPFFTGISLKDFMIAVMNLMISNEVKSEKRASNMLPTLIGCIYHNNSKISVRNDLDAKLANKYKGTAYMAMV